MEFSSEIFDAPSSSPDEGASGMEFPWPLGSKAILLVDLDAFFASVEQLDHPAWRGEPVIVGGSPERHGVVATASYEARAFGVHSAMPSSTAKRLCPDAHWTNGNFARYREISGQVMAMLLDESPFLQQVSIDEAFLDVTPTPSRPEDPVRIARRISERVASLGITCSIGVATSKAVAKIASDMDKPRGLTVVYPGTERAFLAPLGVRDLSGIGAATQRKLEEKGITTLGELAEVPEETLVRLFGKNGRMLHLRANGLDDSPIETQSETKSVSSETTFSSPVSTEEELFAAAYSMAAKVARRLRAAGLKATELSVKVHYPNRTSRSAQKRLKEPLDNEYRFRPIIRELLSGLWSPGVEILLIGIGAAGFNRSLDVQDALFDFDGEAPAESVCEKPARSDALAEATDAIRNRFGEKTVQLGSDWRTALNTTGIQSKY